MSDAIRRYRNACLDAEEEYLRGLAKLPRPWTLADALWLALKLWICWMFLVFGGILVATHLTGG